MGFDAIKARSALGGGRAVGSLVMEKLFSWDRNDNFIPVLKISASPSEGGKTGCAIAKKVNQEEIEWKRCKTNSTIW